MPRIMESSQVRQGGNRYHVAAKLQAERRTRARALTFAAIQQNGWRRAPTEAAHAGCGVNGRAMRLLTLGYNHPAVAPGGAQQMAQEMLAAALRRGCDARLISALEDEPMTRIRAD